MRWARILFYDYELFAISKIKRLEATFNKLILITAFKVFYPYNCCCMSCEITWRIFQGYQEGVIQRPANQIKNKSSGNRPCMAGRIKKKSSYSVRIIILEPASLQAHIITAVLIYIISWRIISIGIRRRLAWYIHIQMFQSDLLPASYAYTNVTSSRFRRELVKFITIT
jgi:hypothetical protein